MERTRIDVGERFGRLTVISYAGKEKGFHMWECICDCGKTKIVRENSLKIGNTSSCGCLHKEIATRICKSRSKHNFNKTRLYRLWGNMKTRCSNKKAINYSGYGGRGITVCDEWNDFENFAIWALNNGYKDNLQLDRKDNNKGYSPDNCRWVTPKVNSNNKRNTTYIDFKGDLHPLSMLASEIGINACTLRYRIKRGWSVERAITTPVNNQRKKKGKEK